VEAAEGEGLPVGNVHLGAMLVTLRAALAEPVPPPEAPADVPAAPLRVCVLGAPFAGVSRQARRAAADLGLAVVSAQQELKEAVEEFDQVHHLTIFAFLASGP
jgi:hypothetical protein